MVMIGAARLRQWRQNDVGEVMCEEEGEVEQGEEEGVGGRGKASDEVEVQEGKEEGGDRRERAADGTREGDVVMQGSHAQKDTPHCQQTPIVPIEPTNWNGGNEPKSQAVNVTSIFSHQHVDFDPQHWGFARGHVEVQGLMCRGVNFPKIAPLAVRKFISIGFFLFSNVTTCTAVQPRSFARQSGKSPSRAAHAVQPAPCPLAQGAGTRAALCAFLLLAPAADAGGS